MEVRIMAVALAALVLGFILGRLSAGKGERYVGQAPGQRSNPPAPQVDAPAGAEEEIFALLRAGNKIEAIKRYREVYGVDLKGAKDAIERLPGRQ